LSELPSWCVSWAHTNKRSRHRTSNRPISLVNYSKRFILPRFTCHQCLDNVKYVSKPSGCPKIITSPSLVKSPKREPHYRHSCDAHYVASSDSRFKTRTFSCGRIEASAKHAVSEKSLFSDVSTFWVLRGSYRFVLDQ